MGVVDSKGILKKVTSYVQTMHFSAFKSKYILVNMISIHRSILHKCTFNMNQTMFRL